MLTKLGVSIKMPEIRDVGCLLTDNLPAGYQTVPGWWAVKESEAVEFLEHPLATFNEAEEELLDRCHREQVAYYTVVAPRLFHAVGMTTVRAFPVWMLTEKYPINP